MADFELKFDMTEMQKLAARLPLIKPVIWWYVGEIVNEATERARNEVAGLMPVDLDLMRSTLKAQITGRGTEFVQGTLVTQAEYAGVVEEGRKPGSFPNLIELRGWVRRKLGTRKSSVVYLIGWAIAHKGTKGVHMFQRGGVTAGLAAQSAMHTLGSYLEMRITGVLKS